MKQLTLEEIKNVAEKMYSLHCVDRTLLRDWTQFVFKAATSGVSDFDIDQFILSDEDFEEKYEKENVKLSQFQKLINLAGFSQNGTNITISLFNDTAVGEVVMSGKSYGSTLWNEVGDSFEKVIGVAYEKHDQKIGIVPNIKYENSFKKLKELTGLSKNGRNILVSFFEDEATQDFTIQGKSSGELLWSVSNTSLEEAIKEAYNKYGSQD